MDSDNRRSAGIAERAEAESRLLPPALLKARRVAGSIAPGRHGSRRPGYGEDFWQFRLARHGDDMRSLDWRRSARSDRLFVKERESQISHSLHIWVDRSRSMSYFSGAHPSKVHCASVMALALAMLVVRSEEKVCLMDSDDPPEAGMKQVENMAYRLSEREGEEEFGFPPSICHAGGAKHVLISDFLGPWNEIEPQLRMAAGAEGILVQILDPSETQFPFEGRTVFTSASGSIEHETFQARSIRSGYLDALEERRTLLAKLAAVLGWPFRRHLASKPYAPTLLWLLGALERSG